MKGKLENDHCPHQQKTVTVLKLSEVLFTFYFNVHVQMIASNAPLSHLVLHLSKTFCTIFKSCALVLLRGYDLFLFKNLSSTVDFKFLRLHFQLLLFVKF